MSFFSTFGFGSKKVISGGYSVTGSVTDVKTCWWLKVNTKPVRSHSLDGAVFPHIVRFTYTVNGREYEGSRYVGWEKRCPHINEAIVVYYDNDDPKKCTVNL